MNTAVSGNQRSSGVAKSQDPNGVLLVDKRIGVTSHDVVDAVRRLCKIRAVGHTGTLDPAASGLMIMLIGRATKIAPFISGLDKCYQAGICLGQTSDTGDVEGDLTASGDPSHVTREQIESALRTLEGEISLRIPAFAAVHVDGKRRYELARSGQTLPPLERAALIHETTLLAFENPMATIRVRCNAGTYIRSLAEAVGEALGCGAYLANLRREGIGEWNVSDARTIHQLEAQSREEGCAPKLHAIEDFLPFTKVQVSADSLSQIANGRPVTANMITGIEGTFGIGDNVLIYTAGQAVAIAVARFCSTRWPDDCPEGDLFSYRRVLLT